MNLIRITFFLIITSVFCACNGGDVPIKSVEIIDSGNPKGSCNEASNSKYCWSTYLGSKDLLPSSETLIPYRNGIKAIIFIDSLKNETVFTVESIRRFYLMEELLSSNAVCAQSTQSRTCEEFETYDVKLKNQVLNINLFIRVRPDSAPAPLNGIGDFLEIWRYQSEPLDYSPQFQIVINQRTFPKNFPRNPHKPRNYDSIILNNQEFKDVHTDELLYYYGKTGLLKYYYHFTIGIVAFENFDGKLWTFDRFEFL